MQIVRDRRQRDRRDRTVDDRQKGAEADRRRC